VADGKVKADKLILWAGIFPPDLEHGFGRNTLSPIKMYAVYGNQDEFLQTDSIDKYINDFKKSGYSPSVIKFEGKHEIHTNTLLKLR
jgi:predicted esterase